MSVSWYTNAASGSNNNGGSSAGSPKNSGTAAATVASNTTVTLLIDNPNMSTVVAGDSIRLNGRTDGIRSTDVFEITAVNNGVGVKTVTVTPTPSSTTSGVTWAIGGALATLTRAALVVRSGEQVNVKTGTNYNEALTISQAGANTAPVIWQAYVSSPGDIYTTNSNKAVIDGQSTRANGIISISGTNHNVFKNFSVKNHTSRGLSAASGDYLTFKRCLFTGNTSDGALCDDNCMFESCDFGENGGWGLDVNSSVCCVGCLSYDNASGSFRSESGSYYKCISVRSGGDGFVTQLNGLHCFFECIHYGDGLGDTGFNISNAQANSNVAIVNCAVQTANVGYQAFSGFSERAISIALGVDDIGADYFVDANEFGNRLEEDPFDWVDPGNLDFTPELSSNLLAAGYGPEVEGGTLTLGGTAPMIGPILPDYSGGASTGNQCPARILTGGNL